MWIISYTAFTQLYRLPHVINWFNRWLGWEGLIEQNHSGLHLVRLLLINVIVYLLINWWIELNSKIFVMTYMNWWWLRKKGNYLPNVLLKWATNDEIGKQPETLKKWFFNWFLLSVYNSVTVSHIIFIAYYLSKLYKNF